MNSLHEKKTELYEYLGNFGGAAVAFSSGADSAFLLAAAREVYGENVIAVTASAAVFPERELREAREFCEKLGVRHAVLEHDVFSVEGFAQNPPDRCYICKRALFTKIRDIAAQNGFSVLLDGTNADDVGDYRPGMAAAAELGVKSPLLDVGLTKSDIRALSKEMGLPTWNKKAFACLATRFPHGETVTREKLAAVEKAEQYLIDLGFSQVRVRVHSDVARIELERADFHKMLDTDISAAVASYLRSLGFAFVSLDLDGYRTGSMNAGLS